jgi:hypothetical protein
MSEVSVASPVSGDGDGRVTSRQIVSRSTPNSRSKVVRWTPAPVRVSDRPMLIRGSVLLTRLMPLYCADAGDGGHRLGQRGEHPRLKLVLIGARLLGSG